MIRTKTVTYEREEWGTYDWQVEIKVDKVGPLSLVKAFANSSFKGPKPRIGRMGSDELIRFKDGSVEAIDLNAPSLPMPGSLVVVSYPSIRDQSLYFTDRVSGERRQTR